MPQIDVMAMAFNLMCKSACDDSNDPAIQKRQKDRFKERIYSFELEYRRWKDDVTKVQNWPELYK